MALMLERKPVTDIIDVKALLGRYNEITGVRPVSRMIDDIQKQATINFNIIEQLKSGKKASQVRTTFEQLGLVPVAVLPNPNMPALLERAFGKIAQYRQALVDTIKVYGGELLNELEFEAGLTISVGVSIGFPPAVMIAVEHTAVVKTITEY